MAVMHNMAVIHEARQKRRSEVQVAVHLKQTHNESKTRIVCIYIHPRVLNFGEDLYRTCFSPHWHRLPCCGHPGIRYILTT